MENLPSKRRWWRFSLKTLLIAITLFCVWLGTLSNSANRQNRAVEAIQQSGGVFHYDYQRVPSPINSGLAFSYVIDPPGPAWLRRILGDHYFITPVYLSLSREITNDCLSVLATLPNVETAYFRDLRLRREDFAQLAKLRNLRSLSFHDCLFPEPERFGALAALRNLDALTLIESSFNDEDAKYLSSAIRLTRLTLYDTSIGDDGAAHFQSLRRLKSLCMSRTDVGDRAMLYLSTLPALEYLSVNETLVSDAAIESFANMSALMEIELHNTQMTPDGISRLRKALPNCKINGESGDGAVTDGPVF